MINWNKINGGFLAPDRIPMETRNSYEMIEELQKENHQLQTRWNSLREWLEELTIPTKTEYGDTTFYDMIKVKFILDKMNELEEDKEG